MSAAFKCDHCRGYFNRAAGGFRWNGEVCDAKHGYVRYRAVVLIYNSKGPPTAEFMSQKPPALGSKGNVEFCDDCIVAIAKAALAKKKL